MTLSSLNLRHRKKQKVFRGERYQIGKPEEVSEAVYKRVIEELVKAKRVKTA